MGSGIFFPICAIPFSLLIIIMFFRKRHIENSETRIYPILITLNFCGLVIEILCTVASMFYGDFPVISDFIYKSYLVYLLSWTGLFTFYIYKISSNSKETNLKIRNLIIALGVIVLIITYVLPIELITQNNFTVRYTVGLSVNFAYTISAIMIIVILIILGKNFKKILTKKYVPVFVFFIVGTLSVIIQNFFPGLLLLTYVETLICVIMYHTIENPDMKLIEELNIARDQAEKANLAKSEFLSSMSHEIRTPLNAIVGFSQSLQEYDIPTEAKEEVNDIISASESLLDLVNGILDISKIEANKLEIVNDEYSINKVLNDVVALTKARMGTKELDFQTNFDSDLPPILYGDHARVKQIIINLLTNSVKYTKEGFINFTVNTVRKGNICRLIISVEDSGIGIKKENIDKLFTKFERFEEKNTTTEGTGLGLAITKKLIELMNGKIVVHSVYGKGSKFTVAIDQKIVKNPTKVVEEIVSEEKEVINLSSKKVLVVDDNKLNVKVANRLLQKYKVQLDEAYSGFECLDKINDKNEYDLILLDDMMPKMSGVETIKKLREISGFDTPIVILTANAITGMREKYISTGFDDYLSKPIDRKELDRVLRKFLNK